MAEAEMSNLSKHAYFLAHRNQARDAYEQGVEVFSEGNALLKELRTVFDWMAQERNAQRIPSRHFKQRLPEIHRKFPKLATSFARMDANSDGWLDWDEFVSFCLKDKRLHDIMRRAQMLTVYGLDCDGRRTYKDELDPAHMCELGMPPHLLPWELSQVVEWRIEGIQWSNHGSPLKHGSLTLKAGTFIASPPFRAAGVAGSLRFWPAGYWTEAARRQKANVPLGKDTLNSGVVQPPSHDTWCCLGVCMPATTHLLLRFFIADERSEKRDIYWVEGINAGQIWAPLGKELPAAVRASDTIVVGVEIFRNLGMPHVPSRNRMSETAKSIRRPSIRKGVLDSADVTGSILLGRPQSLPALLPSNELPKLAKAQGGTAPSSLADSILPQVKIVRSLLYSTNAFPWEEGV